MPKKKTTRKSPAAPGWIKASWKSAKRKSLEDFTMRDVDAIISEVRAGQSSAGYRPAKLSITLTQQQVSWLKRRAASHNCSIEELIMNAVVAYSQNRSSLRKTKSTSPKPLQTAHRSSTLDATKNKYINLRPLYGLLSTQNRTHRRQTWAGRLLGNEVRSQTGQP
jgi:hypothetical protein